ncbi:MAG TPA: hypothetical protein VML55_01140, partial [Planctomycetaceae bacterium]|nr:hypothetical protein [Planctomycetaceae bacterium]
VSERASSGWLRMPLLPEQRRELIFRDQPLFGQVATNRDDVGFAYSLLVGMEAEKEQGTGCRVLEKTVRPWDVHLGESQARKDSVKLGVGHPWCS